jgi:protein associated with RNAse G/E
MSSTTQVVTVTSGTSATSATTTQSSSITRGRSPSQSTDKDLKKDGSKSTAEGEWEMRDGKWYRRDYYAMDKQAPKEVVKIACQMCPTHIQKITVITQERDRLIGFLSDRDKQIVELRARLERWESESKTWINDRRMMEQRISELERLLAERKDWISPLLLREKETLIINLNERIRILMSEKEEHSARMISMQKVVEKWELESRTWINDRRIMEQHIAKLEALVAERRDWASSTFIKEKETIIINLNDRIRQLMAEQEGHARRMTQMQETIETFEKQFAVCKGRGFLCNCKDTPPPAPAPIALPERWYYAVQDPQFAHMFQMDPLYKGGQIVIDALEGATVVNPEYYSQSESVPGMSRLRVRVVDFIAMGVINFAGTELFVRLKLGEATQFTQARPLQYAGVSWNQDMVFVEVPLRPHASDPSASASLHPLVVEIVSRAIGSVSEVVIGSATLDIGDLIHGMTRTNLVQLSGGGAVNLRIKALDFGLIPRGGVLVQRGWTNIQPAQCVVAAPEPCQMSTVSSSITRRTVTQTIVEGDQFSSSIAPQP